MYDEWCVCFELFGSGEAFGGVFAVVFCFFLDVYVFDQFEVFH